MLSHLPGWQEAARSIAFCPAPLLRRGGDQDIPESWRRDGEQMSWRLISGGRQQEAMLCTALVFLHLQYFSSSFQLNQSLSNFQGLQNRGNPYVTHLQSFVSHPLTSPAPESQPCPNINRTIGQYGRGRAALDEGGE